MSDSIASALIQAGPMGVFALYMIWREMRRDTIDKSRTEADMALAASLAALKTVIEDSLQR